MLALNTIKSLAVVANEKELQQFRIERQQRTEKAVVTTRRGNQYNADERSIIRMGNALLAMVNESDDFVIRWSMANTETGVMTETNKVDLVEAHRLAVEFMGASWER